MWTLDALTEAANKLGIRVGLSQVRRIRVADGARWRQVRSWAVRKTRTLSQKDSRRRPVHPHARGHHGRLRRRTRPADFPRLPCPPGRTADGNRVKEEVAYWRELEKTWVYGGLRIRDGHAVTMCADHRDCTKEV